MRIKKLIKLAAALCLASAFLFLFPSDSKAATVRDTENEITYEDSINIYYNFPYFYKCGGSEYARIILDKSNYRVMNVTSSSKNLLAKKTYEDYSTYTNTDIEYDRQNKKTNYVPRVTNKYGFSYISFYGKKNGSYTVSFDIVDTSANNKVVCTKTIKVKVSGADRQVYPVKSITYRGQDLYSYYPFTDKTSGKLSVKLKSGYSLVSIEIGKHAPDSYDYIYKKVKNNSKIKLSTSSKNVHKSTSYTTTYDPLYPVTEIRITYKNKKTKQIDTVTEQLYTIKKKS